MRTHLPPLPKVPGAQNYLPRGENMLDLLGTEHRFLNAMCADVRDDPGQTPVLVAVLCRHLSAERQYFYPAAGAAPDDLLSYGYALSRAKAGSLTWHQALAAVTTAVEQHSRACEGLYEPMRAAFSQTDLVRLGNRVTMALDSAPTRPHPGAPMNTPWNKVTDPLLGAVDKMRDVFTGRRSYPPPAPEAARRRLRTRHIPITQS